MSVRLRILGELFDDLQIDFPEGDFRLADPFILNVRFTIKNNDISSVDSMSLTGQTLNHFNAMIFVLLRSKNTILVFK